MLAFYREYREAFIARYHGRSRAESVWSVLKRVYGNSLSSRKRGCGGGSSISGPWPIS